MVHSLVLRLLACSISICVFLAGCGGPSAQTVSGKLILLPTTPKLTENDSVLLIFKSEDPGGKTVIVNASPTDLTFSATIPTGKYKIGITIDPYPGEKDSEKRSEAFAKVTKPLEADVTPLTYEVTSGGSQSVTIDVARGTVSKN